MDVTIHDDMHAGYLARGKPANLFIAVKADVMMRQPEDNWIAALGGKPMEKPVFAAGEEK